MRKFKILSTPDTRYCMGDLIGMTFEYKGVDDRGLIILDCDWNGDLLFEPLEVMEIY